MDEEIKEVGEMATIEGEEGISIEEDYTTLEAETIIIDDDSNIQTDAEYEQAVEQKELADEAREALSAVLLSVLEKGEINDDDIAEIAAQQEIYTENVTALKILGLTTEDEKSTAGKSTTNVITSNIDYNELMKVLAEKADWLYTDEDGQVMLNGEVVPKLKVVELEAEKIKADVGEFKDLTTENFTAVNAKIDNLEVGDLTAVNADITNLKAVVAEIQTLIGGHLTMDNIQSLVLTADKVTIADALIKNAMIDSISANKIDSGTINTNNVNIQSADGSMVINGTTQQFKDKNGVVRIQIGKDMQGNFTFALFSQDGQGILIDETGIKAGAVPNGLIVNDMVSDNANISSGKLDISSVISSINDNVNTLKSSKIKFDDTNQTLDIAFNQLKSKVETIENITVDGNLSSVIEQVNTNTTNISIAQGQISSLISNTTITKQDGTVIQLKDDYNSTKDTVNSHEQTIGSLETNVNDVVSKQSSLEQNLNGFKTTVSNTYATQTTTNSMLSQIQQNTNSISTKVNVNGVISSINQSSETIAINANKINLNGYVSNDDANWSIDNEGNINAENLNIGGKLSVDTIVVNDIDSPKYPGVITENLWLYVGTNGSDSNELESGVTFASFDGLLDKLSKNLNGYEVRIEMSTDITENVEFKGFHGGRIKVLMKGHTLYGYVNSRMSSARIAFYSGYIGDNTNEDNGWGKIHPSKGYPIGNYTTTVSCEDSGSIALYNIDVYGADNYLTGSNNKVGMAAFMWASIYSNGTSCYGCDIMGRANVGGRIHDALSWNTAAKYGWYATSGGYITLASGNHTGGLTANYREADGGKVIVTNDTTMDNSGVKKPTTTAPTTSATKTVTYKSNYGDTYRSSVYNDWKKDNTVRQGDYGYGNCTGCWFFGAAFSELKGKTITKVQITIKRQTGGTSAPVEHKLWMHGHTGRPSGAPTLTSGWSQTFRLATGNSTTVPITNSAVLNAISAGTCKGFALRHTYDSVHYSVCSGSVTVKITYSE